MNAGMQIIMENAKTYIDRNKIHSLMESEVKAVNNSMVANLYKSAIEKSHVDFDDIPESKGDITRYAGYKSLISSLGILKEISAKNDSEMPEIEVIELAISNIALYRDQFEKGFRLDKEFIILQYNVLVYACVEALSVTISSYVDYVKRPDRIDFTIGRDPKRGGLLSIENLRKFNMSVKRGEFSKVINSVINSGKEGFTGAGAIAATSLIITGVLAIVPLIRELVFSFYYSRMKISDYLRVQAALIEANKQAVQASNAPAREKNEIIKKQEKTMKKLITLADKVKVDRVMSENKATIELNKENKGWTIDSVQTQSASMDAGGFQLL